MILLIAGLELVIRYRSHESVVNPPGPTAAETADDNKSIPVPEAISIGKSTLATAQPEKITVQDSTNRPPAKQVSPSPVLSASNGSSPEGSASQSPEGRNEEPSSHTGKVGVTDQPEPPSAKQEDNSPHKSGTEEILTGNSALPAERPEKIVVQDSTELVPGTQGNPSSAQSGSNDGSPEGSASQSPEGTGEETASPAGKVALTGTPDPSPVTQAENSLPETTNNIVDSWAPDSKTLMNEMEKQKKTEKQAGNTAVEVPTPSRADAGNTERSQLQTGAYALAATGQDQSTSLLQAMNSQDLQTLNDCFERSRSRVSNTWHNNRSGYTTEVVLEPAYKDTTSRICRDATLKVWREKYPGGEEQYQQRVIGCRLPQMARWIFR